ENGKSTNGKRLSHLGISAGSGISAGKAGFPPDLCQSLSTRVSGYSRTNRAMVTLKRYSDLDRIVSVYAAGNYNLFVLIGSPGHPGAVIAGPWGGGCCCGGGPFRRQKNPLPGFPPLPRPQKNPPRQTPGDRRRRLVLFRPQPRAAAQVPVRDGGGQDPRVAHR